MSPKLLAAAVALVAAAPSLSLHAVFSGGQTEHIHAGQVLFAQVRDSGGQGVQSICWDPAPIGRPACGTAKTGAPAHAGPQKVVVTLSDQSTLTKTIDVLAPATRIPGPRMVPATITCARVGLYGNYDQRRHRSRDLEETMPRGTKVGVLNRIAPGKIFMWDYATARGGFASERCARPGLG